MTKKKPGPKKRKYPQRRNKKGKLHDLDVLVEDGRSHYSAEERARIAEYYAVTGSVKKTAEEFGVHQMTICRWKKRDWWHELQREIQERQEEKLRSQFNKIAKEANKELIDRLENGDVFYDPKTGQITRVPMKGADLIKTSAIAYDKRRLSLNQPTKISQGDDEQLQRLADKFAKIASDNYKKIRQEGSIPGEYEEVD